MTAATASRTGLLARVLDRVETAGNRLPDPVTLFVGLGAAVLVASWAASTAGVTVKHPGTGELVPVVNLLSAEGVRRVLGGAVGAYAGFPPLATVLVAVLGIGVAERSGLFATGLRAVVAAVPARYLSFTIVFAGVQASLAADAGFVILVPLGASIFASAGRHPLAGLAAAFAGVSGGFSANLLVTALDPLLGGLTQAGARFVHAEYVVAPTANWYFMVVSSFLVAFVATAITERVVEPRLGPWTAGGEADGPISPGERRGLSRAAIAFALVLGLTAALVATGVLRGPDGGLEPLYAGLLPLLLLAFLLPGIAYGATTGTVKNDRDVARMSAETMSTMGPYLVLAFAAAQFVAWFGWSNLGLVLAVKGSDVLKALGLSGTPLLLGFILLAAGVNLLVASASAKWAVLAPIFVPMLMLAGMSPELTQAAYRVGDSCTNLITPLMPYFPLVLAFARRWVPDVGLGTLVAMMLPYSAALFVVWTTFLLGWVALGIPLGPGVPLGFVP